MSIREKMRAQGGKVVRVAMAGVLAVGLMPLPAFADDLTVAALAPQAEKPTAMSPDGYVIGAAYAAANPAPEILGLNNPNQRYTNEAEQTYNFFGDADINVNPDPYLFNNHHGLTPSVTIGGRQGSPMSALNSYDEDDATAAQNAVWLQQPHIILGTGSDTIPKNEHDFYIESGDAAAVDAALGQDEGTYQPIGVTYNRESLYTMIQTMYRFAEAADEVIVGSETTKDNLSTATLKARYTDNAKGEKVVDIARDYERYIVGQKGVVKKAIDSGKTTQKTIALVQSCDSSAGTYTIITDGVAEGTATTNRYLEAVQGVTYNYYDTVGASGSTKVTKEQLEKNVDVIILGTAAGTDQTSPVVEQLTRDGLLSKTYFCTNWANGSAFGTTVNSVENAQNVGRILPCVYPDQLDQSDMIAYYYNKFYHIESGKVADLIGERMDGVRNWDPTDSTAKTTWEASDVTGYDQAKVEALLKEGVEYLNTQSGLSEYLTPTKYLAADSVKVDLKDAVVTVVSAALVGGKAEPKPTVTYGSTVLTEGTDYTLTYKDNTEAGKTATVTVTAAEKSSYTGSTSASFTVVANDNFSNLTATLSAESIMFTGNAIEPTVTVKEGEVALQPGTDYIVSYANNTNVAASTDENAPTVTLRGTGKYSGTITKAFSITKYKPAAVIDCSDLLFYGKEPSINVAVDSVYLKDGGSVSVKSSDDKVFKVSTGRNGTEYSVVGFGTATLTAEGKATANCEAVSTTKTISVKADISGFGSQLKKLDTDWGYTGSDITAINSGISLKSGDTTLKEGTDYTVSFKRTKDGDGKDVVEDAVTYPKALGTYTMTVSAVANSNYVGTFTFTVNVVPYFRVYKQVGGGEIELAYTFNSKADFEKLVDTTKTDPVSALYSKGGWNVSTAKKYVTLDKIIEKAGLTDVWTDNAIVNYGGDARQAKAANYFTKAQLDKLMFYPKTTVSTTPTEDGVKAPFVFALEEYSSLIGADETASDVQTANLAKANANTAPRSVLGVDPDEFKSEKGGTTTAGKRLWNNITSINIITPQAVTSANDITVSFDKESYEYTGEAIAPTVTVKVGETKLSSDDFSVKFTDNKNVGTTAKATVTLKNRYTFTGSKEATFAITPKDIKSASIGEIADQVYTGSALTPEVTVKDGETALTKGTDYEVEYADNTNVGTATVTITGKGNYTGTNSASFAIGKDISALAFEPIADQTFTGDNIGPAIVVKDGNTNLVANKDYLVTYKDNKNAGTAKVTVTGKGDYIKSKDVTFKIVPKNVTDAMVSDVPDTDYTGSAIEPEVTVKDGDTALEKDTDYEVAYADNTNGGTAKVTVTGKGNYGSSAEKTFKINAIEQSVTTDVSGNAATIEVGKTLAVGAKTTGDGELAYESDNPAVATVAANGTVTAVAAGTATITVRAAATANYNEASATVAITVTAPAPADTTPAAADTTPAVGTPVEDVSTGTSGTTADVKVTSDSAVTVTSVETKANGTVNLNTVTIGGQTYAVTTVAAGALKGSTAKKVTVGNNVTKLGQGALQNTKKLTALSLGKNLKTVGKNALKGSKVKTVTLKSAKLNKKNLTNLVKGSKVKTIKTSGVSAKVKKNYKKWAKSLGITVK